MPRGRYIRTKPVSGATRMKMREKMLGNKHSLGVHPSQETIEKRRKKLVGQVRSDLVRKRMSESRMGIKYSSETIEKMRLAQIGKKPSLEAIEKIRIASTGRKHSVQSRLKMSKARKQEDGRVECQS